MDGLHKLLQGCLTGRRPASCDGAACRALVKQAQRPDPEASDAALGAFCEAGWGQVYGLVRRQGYPAADAEDLTQAYFARFLEKGYIRDAVAWKGCLRPFLRVTVRHFLSNERDRERAAKRGGGRRHVSLDDDRDGRGRIPEPVDTLTPDRILEQKRAAAAFERALERVRAGLGGRGRADRVSRLAAFLAGQDGDSYRSIAADWGVGPTAVRVAAHRLRVRLGRMLQDGTAVRHRPRAA